MRHGQWFVVLGGLKRAMRCGLLFTILGTWVVACGNDVELPNAYHVGYLQQPGEITLSDEADGTRVSWQIASRDNVAGFVISFTDSTGSEDTRQIDDPQASSYLAVDVDIVAGTAVQVWAVDASDFYGPRSTSVMVAGSEEEE
jgi:hypothetical protein